MTVSTSKLVVAIVALSTATAVAQTHTILTNDQSFTTTNSRSLTGTYQCSGAGTIDDCAITDAPITNPTISGGSWNNGTFNNSTFTGTLTGLPTPFPTSTPSNTPVPTATIVPTATPIPAPTPQTAYFAGSTGGDALDPAAVEYFPVNGLANSAVGVADVYVRVPPGITFTTMTCHLTAAPGATKSWAFQAFIDGAAVGTACTITDPATTCTQAQSFAVGVSAAAMATRSTPTGTPAASGGRCTYGYQPS